jgi:hypothetical protein
VTRTIDQLWVLGYCFGVLDAVRQTAELEESGEGVALIAVGFFLLMADDMFAWLADTAKAPTGLSKHVNGSPSED